MQCGRLAEDRLEGETDPALRTGHSCVRSGCRAHQRAEPFQREGIGLLQDRLLRLRAEYRGMVGVVIGSGAVARRHR